MSNTGDDAKYAALKALHGDFELFSANCLSILDKSGKRQMLIMNRAQRYVHSRLEEQKAKTGKVRALILKGRQQGISTLVGGRFYHQVSMRPGLRALIMAHEHKATSNLFNMVKRYDDNNTLSPSKTATNAQELIFGRLDSGYKVATAGSKDTGRSLTAQLAHFSEYAFWENAQQHLAGIGNTLGDLPNTEIIIESTANGLGNSFHLMWQAAEAGQSEYIPIFVPWYWQEEYVADVPEDFSLDEKDESYRSTYKLTPEQMAWRRNKLRTYGPGFEWLFDQEYPATQVLAFVSPTADPLISPDIVSRAMGNDFRGKTGPVLIGCDPAEFGDDRTAIVFRQGRVCYRIETYEKKGPMEVAGLLASYWNEFKPDALFVDKIGIGSGIVDRLRELNIPVLGVNSAQRADDADTYANKRAEMWWRMQKWLNDYPVRLPNDMALMSDLVAPGYKHNSNGLKLLESKESMSKRGLRSTDIADALALTFSSDVAPRNDDYLQTAGSKGMPPASHAGY